MGKILKAVVLGILVGIITSKFLLANALLSLILMGLAALLAGWISNNKKSSLIDGGVYGFFMAFIFMLAGYTGETSVFTRIPFFAIIGLFGGLCGLIVSFLGFFLKEKFKK